MFLWVVGGPWVTLVKVIHTDNKAEGEKCSLLDGAQQGRSNYLTLFDVAHPGFSFIPLLFQFLLDVIPSYGVVVFVSM